MQDNNHRGGGVQRVLSDIFDLCELQWQLLSVDGQEAKRRATKAAIFLVIGGIIAMSALLAAVIGIGWLVHEQLDLPVGVSFLLTAGVALVLASITAVIGVSLLSRANESLSETKREFSENVRWIKSVVLQPDSARNQVRHSDFRPDYVGGEESRFQNMH